MAYQAISSTDSSLASWPASRSWRPAMDKRYKPLAGSEQMALGFSSMRSWRNSRECRCRKLWT
jgi:hypothetical protein